MTRVMWGARAVALFAVACGGPADRSTPIRTLLGEPGRYEGRAVSVRGRVRNVVRLPFVREQLFQVADSTGAIYVVTYDTLPAMGALTTVTGRFTTAVLLGRESYGAHIVVGQRRPEPAASP